MAFIRKDEGYSTDEVLEIMEETKNTLKDMRDNMSCLNFEYMHLLAVSLVIQAIEDFDETIQSSGDHKFSNKDLQEAFDDYCSKSQEELNKHRRFLKQMVSEKRDLKLK